MFKYGVLVLLLFTAYGYGQTTDPTRPFGSTFKGDGEQGAKQVSQYLLQTIIDNGEHQRVVINGKLLALGDRIGPYQLSKINSQSVVLTSLDNELTMSLFSPVVTK